MKKLLVVGVIVLLIGLSVTSIGVRVSFDDITPPVTTCTLNPPEPNGNNSWYVSDVEFTLNATDDISGVNVTQFRVDGGNIQTYTEPFNVTMDGQHTIEYRSIDYAGNIEDWKSVEFKIDQTKPYIELGWENPGNIYVIFTADCSDATSGMDYVEFYVDDICQFTDYAPPYEWSIEWSTALEDCEFYAYAYDIAGNDDVDYIPGSSYYISSDKYVFQRLTFPNNYEGYIGRFLISSGNRASFDDITPPVTTCTLNPPEPNGENGWYVSDVEVTLNATDDMSGVNATYWRIDGGAYQIYTEPFNIPTDGEHTVEYRSIDYAGNIEDWKSVEFKIDQTKPQIVLYWDVGNINDDLIFTADCADAISGMNYVEFYQDEELMCIDNAAPFDWHIPGAGEVKYSAVGLIFNPQFYEEDVTVFALFVRTAWSMPFFPKSSLIYAIGYDMAGNSATDDSHNPPHIWNRHIFERLTFTSNYTGHIGRFFIRASFEV